jgi:hypothetical protein
VIAGRAVFAGGTGGTIPVAAERAVTVVPPSRLVLLAVTSTTIVCPMSLLASVYVVEVAPEMLEQLAPEELQSNHWYVYASGVLPDQPPALAVNVRPASVVPVIAGRATSLSGGCARTVDVCVAVASPLPDMFESVTTTRMVSPMSLFASVYVSEVAPEMLVQLAPEVLQSSH